MLRPAPRPAVRALALLGLALAAACDRGPGGATSTEPVAAPPPGAVTFGLRRNTSPLPAGSDSALVRLTNGGTGFREVRRIRVPDVGQATQVSFSAPAGTGYQVEVLPFFAFASQVQPTAYGASGAVTISAGQNSAVDINVAPIAVTITAPPEFAAGTRTPVTVSASGIPAAVLNSASVVLLGQQNNNSTQFIPTASDSHTATSGTWQFNYDAPPSGVTAVGLQLSIAPQDGSGWATNGGTAPVFIFYSARADRTVNTTGSMTVTFDKSPTGAARVE